MKRLKIFSFLVGMLCLSATASNLTPEMVNGTYHLTTPERGKSQVLMQFGKLSNKNVIAVAACKTCTPAVYSYMPEESKTLGTEVFFTGGLYLIQFNSESFALVQPDGLLGRKVWSKLGHVNLYSKSQSTAQQTPRADVEKFAIELSNKIMNQEVRTMAHQAGEYYLAVPQKHMGRASTSYQIEIKEQGKKQIIIQPCDRCSKEEYNHLPQESGVIGVDVYRHASSHYLFDLKDGVFIYTFSNASGLGKSLWGKSNNYNVYSNNKAYIRQILASKEKQQLIDNLMAQYFSEIKKDVDRRAEEERQKRFESRKLPAEVLVYSDKSALADAAKRWANAWGWKETLKSAYLTQKDWSITRNPLTGIITGKVIRGIATMTHPDGRCRYQIVSFRKDFDGNQYMNLHVTGIGPIYDIKCELME